MTTIRGFEGKVKVGSDVVAEITNWEIEEQGGVIETTSLDNANQNKTFKSGFGQWQGSLECHYDPSDTAGQGALDPKSTVTLNLYPESDTTGKKYFTGSAIITNKNINMGGLEDTQKVSISFQGTGDLTEATVA